MIHAYSSTSSFIGIIRNGLPLQTVGTTSGVVTRQVNSLYVKRSRTDTGARQMEIRGPKLWNMLPDNIRVINSFCNFKTKLKEHLLNKL